MDLVAILLLSAVAQATHFSYQQGRAVISGDSAQYVASADAILTPGKTPHFEMRKPGYILFLAGVALVLGNMGYAVVACQHALLALLPLGAYGVGRHLHGRGLGWLAAMVTIAKLQDVFRADRVMSEVLFTVLFTFGLLLFMAALKREMRGRWLVSAGALLGLAWLTRGTATPVIAVAFLILIFATRQLGRRAILAMVAFGVPIAACVAFECGLNARYAGRFRPTNGTAGATLLLRARNFEGFDWPDSADVERVLALVPRRDREDAYVAHLLDAWVARYHAIHDLGMNEWTYDELMGRVGLEMLLAHADRYLLSSLRMTFTHLLRRTDGQSLSPIDPQRRAKPLVHPLAPSSEEVGQTWFAYYGLPHKPLGQSIAFVDRMKVSASRRAPFGRSELWRALRYWKTKPAAMWTLSSLSWLGSLWPGFALLACPWLGLNRRMCAFLALAYVADALFIGFLTPTTARLQFPWLVTDVVLAVALPVGVLGIVVRHRVWRESPRHTRSSACARRRHERTRQNIHDTAPVLCQQ